MDDIKIKVINSDKLIKAINEGSYDVNLSAVMALGAVMVDSKKQETCECCHEEFDTEKDENQFIHLVRDMAPPAQPEYEPVKAEDFAKTMSENTRYSFVAWHQEALELMEKHGFVICRKR